MSRPLVTSVAEQEFADALEWYFGRSQAAAERFEVEFARALDEIGANPERYPLIDDRHRYYLLARFPYQVVYRRHGDDWYVVAVAHGRRRPGYWRDR
jgi:plasmid stabilization system protein ParE